MKKIYLTLLALLFISCTTNRSEPLAVVEEEKIEVEAEIIEEPVAPEVTEAPVNNILNFITTDIHYSNLDDYGMEIKMIQTSPYGDDLFTHIDKDLNLYIETTSAKYLGDLNSFTTNMVTINTAYIDSENQLLLASTKEEPSNFKVVFIDRSKLSKAFVYSSLGSDFRSFIPGLTFLEVSEQELLIDLFYDFELYQSQTLFIPFNPIEVGGDKVIKTVSKINIDISPILYWEDDRLILRDNKTAEIEYNFIYKEIGRESIDIATLYDFPPGYRGVNRNDSVHEKIYSFWRDSKYPLFGVGPISNHMWGGENCAPLVIYTEDNGEDNWEGVELYFQMSEEDLAKKIEEEEFFYYLQEFEPGIPKALVIGANSIERVMDEFETNSDFMTTINEFYIQKFDNIIPQYRD